MGVMVVSVSVYHQSINQSTAWVYIAIITKQPTSTTNQQTHQATPPSSNPPTRCIASARTSSRIFRLRSCSSGDSACHASEASPSVKSSPPVTAKSPPPSMARSRASTSSRDCSLIMGANVHAAVSTSALCRAVSVVVLCCVASGVSK